MEDRNYIIILYDFYGELFSSKQREYFESYYFDNLSLQEISDNLNISRNAIHKGIKSMVNKLYFYEDVLKLYEKNQKLNEIIREIENKDIREKLRCVLESE